MQARLGLRGLSQSRLHPIANGARNILNVIGLYSSNKPFTSEKRPCSFSTTPLHQDAKAARTRILSKFDDFISSILSPYHRIGAQNDVVNYLKQCLEYNVLGGKMDRGLMVQASYLEVSPFPTQSELNLSDMVALCVETYQAFLLVADDLMDGSETRRGKLCWYKHPNVGLRAVNDTLFIEASVYSGLSAHARQHPAYGKMMDLFHMCTMLTCYGQEVDMACERGDGAYLLVENKCAQSFDHTLRDHIAEHKTAIYSFYLPLSLGMALAGVQNEAAYETTRRLCVEVGRYFQAQDDFLDCFGDPKVTGKIGTDIQENKCTWLVAEALSRGTDDHVRIIRQNYGRGAENMNAVQAVKDVYTELGIVEAFREYEETTRGRIRVLLDDVENDRHVPTGVLREYVERTTERQK